MQDPGGYDVSQEAAPASDAAEEETVVEGSDGTAYDPERAQATIAKQRQEEKLLKASLKELEAKLDGYTKAELEAAEAQKDALTKVAERDAEIERLHRTLSDTQVKNDFISKAAAKGLQDPGLAFLAAKEQGLLGEYDPKVGSVGEHDWEELGERYPSFQTTARPADNGEAGKTGSGKVTTTSAQFNNTVRQSMQRR